MKLLFGLVVVLLLNGCSGLAAINVGDTTYSTGIYLEKEVKTYE
jgi:hypothetical protein